MGAAAGDIGGEGCGGSRGSGVSQGVGKAEDGGLVANVRGIAERRLRVEGQAAGLVEAGSVGALTDGGASGVDAAEDGDCTGALLGEEDVPVGGSEEITGVAQTAVA